MADVLQAAENTIRSTPYDVGTADASILNLLRSAAGLAGSMVRLLCVCAHGVCGTLCDCALPCPCLVLCRQNRVERDQAKQDQADLKERGLRQGPALRPP